MREIVKSVALAVLVMASLFQTYLLTYGTSTFEQNRKTEYVPTGLGGIQEKVENLLFPERIFLHFGNGSHAVLYPDTAYYTMIYERIRKGRLDGVRAASVAPERWKEIRDTFPGVEIRFVENTPLSVLRQIIPLDSSFPPEAAKIDRLWLYIEGAPAGKNSPDGEGNQSEAEEKGMEERGPQVPETERRSASTLGAEEPGTEGGAAERDSGRKNTEEDRGVVKGIFFLSSGNAVFEAANVDLTVGELQDLVSLGMHLPRYRVFEERFYVPEQPLNMSRYRIPYKTLTVEQLQKSLFLDPDITRNLKERNGSEIFTDGKRGLQIDKDGLWMSFTDPIAPTEGNSDELENLFSAVKFINQHEGWSGKHSAQIVPQNPVDAGQMILFRQYYDSYPIVDIGGTRFGLMKVTLQKGAVSGYERSLIHLRTEGIREEGAKLAGGKALEELLQKFPRKKEAKDLFLAFVPHIGKEEVELVPAWIVALQNGEYKMLAGTE